ncbi:MAG: hypothetical protein ACK5GA_08210, partial [Holosporaceae bacterium]
MNRSPALKLADTPLGTVIPPPLLTVMLLPVTRTRIRRPIKAAGAVMAVTVTALPARSMLSVVLVMSVVAA